MKLAELPRLHNAIVLMGLDNGANAVPDAVIPPDWETRAQIAEGELLDLMPSEVEDLVFGEETDQQTIVPRAPVANEILNAAFDGGPLSDLFFVPWENIFDARAAEKRYAERHTTPVTKYDL